MFYIVNYFRVNVSGERETQKVVPTDVYGETTMKQMKYELKDNIWVKKDAIVVEDVNEEAQMDKAEAQGNEDAMHEDEEPPTAPPSSSCVNEDNFQLVFGRLDSLATSMGNLTTSMGNLATNMDNFSTMVTQSFSTYDENFARLEQAMEDINERLRKSGM